jgi:hypothetical protein
MDNKLKYLSEIATIDIESTDHIVIKQKKVECECRPFGNDDAIFFLTKTPNVFHRKIMEWIFGFKFKIYGQHDNKH